MALSALKRITEQFLGHGSQDGDQHGTDQRQQNGKQYAICDGQSYGSQHGEQQGHQDGHQDGNAQFCVVGDRLVRCPPDRQLAPSAYEHAVRLLSWLREILPPRPRVLWVAAYDLEHVFYPQFLAATEWPTHSWKTVAGQLRKLVDWRQ